MQVQLPEKMQFLFEPHRYKVLYGGRGGAKSWGIAIALLLIGAQKPTRIFCGREIQKSIKNSVHKLLSDQIKAMGLQGFYTILQTEIRGKNGTEFIFDGLKHNIDNIKSLESADIAWIEEAQTVSKSSWDKLIPTIRKEGSEIWLSFNPELEDDETYARFVKNPPASAKVVKLGWQDNPWFPSVLKLELEDLRTKDPDAYLHVWEGHCKLALEGAVYADEIRKATEQGRITKVPHTSNKGVTAVFDLGHSDATAIWFVQTIGHEFRIIDYYENQFKKIQHYMEYMQGLGYMFDRLILPHDARYETLSAERTTEQIVRSSFPNATVQVLSALKVKDGIDAARTVFEQCWFDETKCADGLQALRHYKYDKDPDTGKVSINPVHDWSSHGADAFRYLAVSVKLENKTKPKPLPMVQSGSWMSL
jgi:phage terminase large subunit